MTKPDFYLVVRHALEHHNDLETLEKSPLRALQVLWPLPSVVFNDSFQLPIYGVGVQYLLTKALKRLADQKPEFHHILTLRYYSAYDSVEIQHQLNLPRPTYHRHLQAALKAFSSLILAMELETIDNRPQRLQEQLLFMTPPLRDTIVGISVPLQQLRTQLRYRLYQSKTPIVVTGLGGIGKTSLITATLKKWLENDAPPIERVLWARVTAVTAVDRETHIERVIDLILSHLAQQLDVPLLILPTLSQRLASLVQHLSRFRHRFVIVVDNVETPIEHSGAMRFAWELAGVAIVIVGSRRDEVQDNIEGAMVLPVRELVSKDAKALVIYEANDLLVDEEVNQILETVGGHPLALLLVVAQCRRLPLTQVLSGLQQDSFVAEVLYQRIYQQAWDLLTDIDRSVLCSLIALPIEGVHLRRLMQLTRTVNPTITPRQIEISIYELATLNLLQIAQSQEPLYFLHRLTYHFIEQRMGIAFIDNT